MEKGIVEVYCGGGKGKTTLAIGQSLRACVQGSSVIIIQFLKGNERRELDFLEDMEDLDIKIFRFERSEKCYEDLSEQEKEEQKINIINGMNFARKVITTQECDLLVLDEILGLLDYDIVTTEQVNELLKAKSESMDIILTGRCLHEDLRRHVDSVTTLETEEVESR
ncbi:MAG: cob(I)yrinic acid a,c-diamide adenosyltransferase [Blautia sp.]|jgi:cob(I)alamin adenosyltransferase